MSLFRRKLESKKTPDESSGAQASSRPGEEAGPAEERVSSPSDEQAAATEQAAPSRDSEKQGSVTSEPTALRRELHRGSIAAPAEGTFVGGTIEIEASLAEGASNTGARLEWSQDEREWNPVKLPGDDYELLAARAGAISSRIALVRSIELAEAKKLSLEQEGYERIELSPARPSSWQGRQLFHVGFDTTSLPEGSCFLRLVTISAEGEKVASDPVRVLVDNLGPEIGVRESLEGRTLSGLVTVTVDAEDAVSGVSVVELEISSDGKSWRPISDARQAPYVLRLNADELADGSYQLRVVARDGSGNVSSGEPWEIEIANTPTAAELVDPGEYLRGRVNLIARAPDKRSTQMIFAIAATGSDDWRVLGTTRPPFHLSVDTRQVVDGSSELRIESLTATGLSTYSGRFGPYIVDNTPPSVEIVEPRDGSELSERTELVVGVSDESSGPAQVVLGFTEGGEWRPLAELEPEADEVRGFWHIDECQPGHCQLRATAYDRAGNSASQTIGITIMPPEPKPKPEKTAAESSSPDTVRAPSSGAATRFGSVPNWDWQRRSPEPEETKSEEVSPEREAAAESSPEPSAEAPAPALKPQSSSVAWSWKAQKPAPEQAQKPETEPEQVIRLVEPSRADEVAAADEASSETVLDEVEPEEELSETDCGAETGGRLISFPSTVRGWNIWRLSELVEDVPGQDPIRQEERRQILYHLRAHTALDGLIPSEFEDLVYEAFGDLIRDEPGR